LLRFAARVFGEPPVADDYAASERQIILREYEMRMGQNPRAQAYVEALADIYGPNNLD
jgi:predicted Zn-dependent peptidase